jgi:hypothetical protein
MPLPDDPTPTQLLSFLSHLGLKNVMVVFEETIVEDGEAYSDTFVHTAGEMSNERALWLMEKAKLGLMGMEI